MEAFQHKTYGLRELNFSPLTILVADLHFLCVWYNKIEWPEINMGAQFVLPKLGIKKEAPSHVRVPKKEGTFHSHTD